MALVRRDDVAAALAGAALAGRTGVVRLTGPDALTAREIAALAEAATGRPLRYDALAEEEYRRRLVAEGAPAWLVAAFTSMFASVREGRFAAVSADVAELAGAPAASFAEFMRAA